MVGGGGTTGAVPGWPTTGANGIVPTVTGGTP